MHHSVNFHWDLNHFVHMPAAVGDWTGSYPVTFNIVGGSGAYQNVLGGRALFTSDSKLDLTLFS